MTYRISFIFPQAKEDGDSRFQGMIYPVHVHSLHNSRTSRVATGFLNRTYSCTDIDNHAFQRMMKRQASSDDVPSVSGFHSMSVFRMKSLMS